MPLETGYEGPFKKEEPEKIPAPDSREWKIEYEPVGMPEKVYVRVLLDGKVIGMLQLPNNEHLLWLRRKLTT